MKPTATKFGMPTRSKNIEKATMPKCLACENN